MSKYIESNNNWTATRPEKTNERKDVGKFIYIYTTDQIKKYIASNSSKCMQRFWIAQHKWADTHLDKDRDRERENNI